MKKKDMVLPSDVEKVRLDIFDENDPVQYCQKIMVGCGIYFGFHRRSEHASLQQCNSQRELKEDKKLKVSTHNK